MKLLFDTRFVETFTLSSVIPGVSFFLDDFLDALKAANDVIHEYNILGSVDYSIIDRLDSTVTITIEPQKLVLDEDGIDDVFKNLLVPFFAFRTEYVDLGSQLTFQIIDTKV